MANIQIEVRKAKPVRSSDEGKITKEYVVKLLEMWKDPDPTFMEQPCLKINNTFKKEGNPVILILWRCLNESL